MTDTY